MDLQHIESNLRRQLEALKVLRFLLEEEFEHLSASGSGRLAENQLAIQELMRQIVFEREDMVRLVRRVKPKHRRLTQILPLVRGDQKGVLQDWIKRIDEQEKICSKQAEHNADLAMALVEQSQALLDFMQEQVKPQTSNTYSRKGGWQHAEDRPSLIQGRL
jgi:flagellar biosynthesis/type III secretory pathway chaperone